MGRVKKSIRKILRKNSAGVGGYNEEIYAEEILIQNNIHGQIGNFVFGRSVLVMREHVASLCIDGELRRMRSTFMSLGNCLRSQEIKGLAPISARPLSLSSQNRSYSGSSTITEEPAVQ